MRISTVCSLVPMLYNIAARFPHPLQVDGYNDNILPHALCAYGRHDSFPGWEYTLIVTLNYCWISLFDLHISKWSFQPNHHTSSFQDCPALHFSRGNSNYMFIAQRIFAPVPSLKTYAVVDFQSSSNLAQSSVLGAVMNLEISLTAKLKFVTFVLVAKR